MPYQTWQLWTCSLLNLLPGVSQLLCHSSLEESVCKDLKLPAHSQWQFANLVGEQRWKRILSPVRAADA